MAGANTYFTHQGLECAGEDGVRILSPGGDSMAIGHYHEGDKSYSLQVVFKDTLDGLPPVELKGLEDIQVMNRMTYFMFSGEQAVRGLHNGPGHTHAFHRYI